MTCPIYKDSNAPGNRHPSAHSGLWFDRFFNLYNSGWQIDEKGKQAWINTVRGRIGDSTQLDSACNGMIALLEKLNGEVSVMKSQWHFATGLGNPHPVENGFAWHHTLGVPYLTGAAVKGLVRAWIEQWEEPCDTQAAKLNRWFGNDMAGGSFIFFDALPIGPVLLACDIMTPHMGDWYEKGGEEPLNPEVTPADWHNPVPVTFLAAKDIKLMFAIAPRHADVQSELSQVMETLKNSLEWLGAGAKTAVGYGRFEPDEKAQNEIIELRKKAKDNESLSRLGVFPNRLAIEKLRLQIESRLPRGKIAVSDAFWDVSIKQFASKVLINPEWSSEDKSALADMLEEWAGKLMKLDAKDLRKQLQLNALRGKT